MVSRSISSISGYDGFCVRGRRRRPGIYEEYRNTEKRAILWKIITSKILKSAFF